LKTREKKISRKDRPNLSVGANHFLKFNGKSKKNEKEKKERSRINEKN
jgi:hypothetical protein